MAEKQNKWRFAPVWESMTPTCNPFDNPDLASRYEGWYVGPGQAADLLEKRLLEKLLLEKLLRGFPKAHTALEIGCRPRDSAAANSWNRFPARFQSLRSTACKNCGSSTTRAAARRPIESTVDATSSSECCGNTRDSAARYSASLNRTVSTTSVDSAVNLSLS